VGGLAAVGQAANGPVDNRDVYFYMDSHGEYMLEDVDRRTVNAAIDGEYRPTDLAFHYDYTPVFRGSGETDIVYQEGSTGLSGQCRRDDLVQHGDKSSLRLSNTDSRLGCLVTPSSGRYDLGANNRTNINATY
jgi:hypothetical protein